MPQNMTEAALEGITITIEFLERDPKCNPEILKELKVYRTQILRRLNLQIE